jgi:sugar fermentation stimulation protein A
MEFPSPLQAATFLRRYKRFLVDVRLPTGEEITVHCPNTGSMLGCLTPGCEVRLLDSANPKRAYRFTLELTRPGEWWIGVNTSRANALVREALLGGVVTELAAIDHCQPEVKVDAHSRLDFLLTSGGQSIYLEVKNCTLAEEGVALFPDAVTTRGAKHLQALMGLRRQGHGAVIFYCVQRQDAGCFAPAGKIDPLYARTLREAVQSGVLALAYQAEVSEERIIIRHPLPVDLG